jgi:GT2 family glycosyltransferase
VNTDSSNLPPSAFPLQPSSPRRLAIVILTWNGKDDTLACLASLEEAGFPREQDAVVVVDNGSSDMTLNAVEESFPWVERVQNPSNFGFAAGNNVGIRWAITRAFPYIMLLNNDTEVPPGALDTLVAYMEEHPEVGAVQPLLVRHGDRNLIDSSGVELFSLPGARDRQIERPVDEAPKAAERVFGACAAAAVYRTAPLRKACLLDEAFFVLLEDVDLSFKIRLEGYDIVLVPEARVYHKRGISSQGKISGEKKYILHRNLRALAIRYWPRKYLLQYAPFLLKGWLWGYLYAERHDRSAQWAKLMRRSRGERRHNRHNRHWREIQREWMQPLGWSYYWRKLRERLGGPPAIS